MGFSRFQRVSALPCLLVLAACGGGGGVSNGSTAPIVNAPPPNITIQGAGHPSLGGNSFPAPNALTAAFTNHLPTANVEFPLMETVVYAQPGVLGSYSAAATLTRTGSTTVSGQTQGVYELKIPALNVDATNLVSAAPTTTLADGRKAGVAFVGLNYSLLGAWTVTPVASTDPAYLAMGVSGYQSTAALPTSGTATYVGNTGSGATAGGVIGGVFVTNGSNVVNGGTLQGNANLTLNFSNNTINGSLSSMTVTDTSTGATSPWNTVNLTGSVTGGAFAAQGALSGSTSVGSTPAGSLALGSSATGVFSGGVFGPNGEEVGAAWTLTDSGGKKAAFGAFGATKQ